jgi:nicotinic acetylcholine receptor
LPFFSKYEKEQIMKTNVWINLRWTDFQLNWTTNDYKVGSFRVPYDRVWTPDIVLFNNADGNYEASYKPNVVVYADVQDGPDNTNILWIPPAIYKSSCTIDVKYFPFDEQQCEMRFGSWTFDALQVRLKQEKPMVNLEDYLPSGTWDIIEVPGKEVDFVDANRMELVYTFKIRRKTLFYTVNLIIPTVLISFLSIFVFYLPTDEGEKMTLCISILLALVVFLLLVSKILPPTSMVIPLISKYLIFTLLMNIVTIVYTVIIINYNYRTPRTHNMPQWVLSNLLSSPIPFPPCKAKRYSILFTNTLFELLA